MLALFALSAITSVAALQLSIDGLDEQVAQKQAFDALRVAHNRAYDETHDEYKMRFATFLDNIERIRKRMCARLLCVSAPLTAAARLLAQSASVRRKPSSS